MTRESKATNLRVGIFLAVAVVAMAIAVFMVGEKSGLFEGKTEVYTHFADINGLVEGAPVRLAGLDVGTVTEIRFPEALEHRKARVTLSIKSRYMRRIRADSVAFIDSKGLLGDKLINISLGGAGAAEVPDGGTLPTKTAASIEQLSGKLEEAIEGVAKVAKSADQAIQEISSEQVRNDIGRIAASVANIFEAIEKGDGLAHELIFDGSYDTELRGVLGDARGALSDLRAAIARVDRTVASVEHGDGLAHELFYGAKGKQAIADVSQSAADVSAMIKQARDGDGLLHALVYDPENAKAVTELKQASERINRIVAEVEKGRGTIGALMTDPSVYEDLKTVLGNVERNVLLKSLIRFTIKEGDIERPANQRVRRVPEE
jgi:phospholipid/cholesterol/gamma-HCH transport system substrate-binding protein